MATKVYRFALGSPEGPLSAIWRVWTQDDEVHVAVRTALEDVTLTAYPTGRWRITVGSAVSRWTRPKEFRPGWTRGPDIIIPHRGRAIPATIGDPFARETVAWLPPPAPRGLARFSLLFASPRAAEGRWQPADTPGSRGVTVLPLRTAGALHICRVDEPLNPDDMSASSPSATTALQVLAQLPDRPSSTLVVIVSADQAGRPTLRESHEA